MTDLHTHILPGIDDGAKNIEQSIQLLKAEIATGVNQIAFTPHFYFERQLPDDFLKAREQSHQRLMQEAERQGLRFQGKLAAELFFSTGLTQLDLKQFCIEGTNYLLMEFSMRPDISLIEDVLFDILGEGFIPILAHVERYHFLMDNPELLEKWIHQGVLIQVNAGSLLKKGKTSKFLRKLIQWGMVHIISSDVHSLDRRPPNLAEGMAELKKYQNRLEQNADRVFQGKFFRIDPPYTPKKRFGIWM